MPRYWGGVLKEAEEEGMGNYWSQIYRIAEQIVPLIIEEGHGSSCSGCIGHKKREEKILTAEIYDMIVRK